MREYPLIARKPSIHPKAAMKERTQSTCPLCYSLDIFGDRWTLLIIRDVLLGEKRNYRDFLRSGEGIATNILADRLKHLVEHGMLTREDDRESGTQTLYMPTEKALALMPVIDAMTKWGLEHGPDRLKPPTGWSIE
ncbi:helix-turn-helix domain-containing protein [Paraburkholderia sp. 22B1P]|uniref:winged helix-turn-helix transcriptional regulator n=1 Tax=Paraburkholderia sp. 22B1P TaxID=3080498 RepID=UPI00308CDF63|nr:helix-turn-helix domain-containing protein [Paraburkholderia sp. 22B1P]